MPPGFVTPSIWKTNDAGPQVPLGDRHAWSPAASAARSGEPSHRVRADRAELRAPPLEVRARRPQVPLAGGGQPASPGVGEETSAQSALTKSAAAWEPQRPIERFTRSSTRIERAAVPEYWPGTWERGWHFVRVATDHPGKNSPTARPFGARFKGPCKVLCWRRAQKCLPTADGASFAWIAEVFPSKNPVLRCNGPYPRVSRGVSGCFPVFRCPYAFFQTLRRYNRIPAAPTMFFGEKLRI